MIHWKYDTIMLMMQKNRKPSALEKLLPLGDPIFGPDEQQSLRTDPTLRLEQAAAGGVMLGVKADYSACARTATRESRAASATARTSSTE